MTNKITSMFSRLAAQFLKPTLALLAACIVGGAWAWTDIDWTGNSESTVKYWDDTANWNNYNTSITSDGAWRILKSASITFRGNDGPSLQTWIAGGVGDNRAVFSATEDSYGFDLKDGWFCVGTWNDGELTISNGTHQVAWDLHVGYAAGWDASCTGVFTLKGGTFRTGYWLGVGEAKTGYTSTGKIFVEDGSLVVGYRNGALASGDARLNVGVSANSTGVIVQTGGTVSSSADGTGNAGDSAMAIGVEASSSGIYTISNGTYTTRSGKVQIAVGTGSTGTLNVHGGVFSTSAIESGAGTATISLDGGTLSASAGGTFISSGITMTVGSNGGTIDVGANNVMIAATVTGTGAIIKKGSGTLTFTGNMSGFTGQIVVEEGCGTVSIPTASIGVIAAGTGTGSRVVGDNTIFLPSKFYWIGGSSGNWDDGSKWSLTEGGSAIGVYPANSGDKARFATTAGTVTLQTTAALTLNCDIDIPEGITLDFVPNDKSLTCNGSFTGRGILSMRSNTSKKNTYAGMHLHGDNSEFAGTVKIYSDANQQRDTHDLNGLGSSSNATWRVYVDGAKNLSEGPFKTDDQTNYLGAAQVKFYKPNSGGFTGANCVFEVGALDIDSSFSAVDSNAKYGSMCKLRWIAPTATLTHDVGNLQILEICGGGTVEVGTTYSLPLRIKFSDKGGTLKTAADPSAVLTQSEVAICYDDEGNNRTWATALASSNVGGIVKKGTGTLTLSAAPAWTSAQPITVMDGKLVVNDSSFANYTIGEGTKVTTVDSTLVFAPDARATVTFADTETYSLSVSVNNSAIASGDKIDAGETLVISANAIAGYKVTSILVNGVAISGNEYSVATGDVEGGVVISAVAKAVVAKIGDKEYASLEDALADAVSGDVILLCGDVVLDKNLTLVEGVTVNANGYAITRGEYGVYCPDGYHELSESGEKVYLRTAFIWNGGTSGTWTESVWLVNGETSSAPSQPSDVVVVANEATIAMNSGRTGQLYVEADVTFTGTMTVDVIKGTGMVIFNGTTLNGGSGQTIYIDAYFTGSVNANTASLVLYGKFKGDASNIKFTSSGSYSPGFGFHGDVSEFVGLYTGGRAGSNVRDNTKIFISEFNGASGSWDFDLCDNSNDGYVFHGGDSAVYKFGYLKNEKFTFVTYHASSGDTIAKNCEVEVGAIANKSSTVNGTLSDDSNTFRKVGTTSTCDLTLTESKGTVEIKEGLLNLAGTLPNEIKFTGGTLKTALDPSACIASSTSAIVFDDWGETYEWASAIADSNKAGLTKKGSGSLTLSAPPAYTGATTVEGGALYIVEGYSPTLAAGTVEMVSDKTGYKKYVPVAAAVAHVGNLYYPTFAEAWAAAGNDDNAAWIYLDSELAQNDIVTLDTAWQRVRVANGTYSADGHIAISGSLANVALKTLLGAEMTEYTAYPTVTVTVVPGAGVASGEIAAGYISKDGATYTIYSGSEVTITWTAAEGYEFAGGQSTATTVISPTENVTPQCPAATAVVVGSVSIAAPVVGAYGNDFATVSVTAGVTSTYPAATTITYTLKANETAIATTTAAGDATSVTFDKANVSGLSRYDNISYTVEASGDNVTAATSGATTAMLADADEGWIDEKKSTTGTTGSWKTADGAAATVTYGDDDSVQLSDNKFSANNCSTGDVVTVTIKDVIYTALSDTSTVDGDAQGSVALGGTESAPKFMVLTKSGNEVQWSEATGVDPSLNTPYTIVFKFDYTSNKYSITVGGTPLTVGGSKTYDIVKTTNKYVKDIDFLGAGSIKAIEGIQYDAMMAVDQNGVRYATVDAALDANKNVKGAVIKLLHGTANTSIAGWRFDEATMSFIKKAMGMVFLAF